MDIETTAPLQTNSESTLKTALNQANDSLRVIRRNGSVAAYNGEKIANAIKQAFLDVEGNKSADSKRIENTVRTLTLQLTNMYLQRFHYDHPIHIEDIQDQVELTLMRAGEQKVKRETG
jgi:ribonucleoside-diphosphate reductase alpha chain